VRAAPTSLWRILLIGLLLPAAGDASGAPAAADRRLQADRAYGAGHWKAAFEAYSEALFQADADDRQSAQDFVKAADCLAKLNRESELDGFRDRLAAAHHGRWRLLQEIANSYAQGNHYGYLIAGAFHRGHHRGGGTWVSALERDRVRALQLMNEALPIAEPDPNRAAVAAFYLNFARTILNARGHADAWQLAELTDLAVLPDYAEGRFDWDWGFAATGRGAPVDEDGHPVFHHRPAGFAAAAADGERWRWLLEKAGETHRSLQPQAQLEFADFLCQQFGARTLADFRTFFHAEPGGTDAKTDAAGVFALHTLGDHETIARLATGVRRFTLPDEFNFLRVYRDVAETGAGSAESALNRLAEEYSDRRQFPRSAEYWRAGIERFGAGPDKWKSKQLQQITGIWGQFERTLSQPAGEGAVIDYRFRNGRRVTLEAHRIDTARLVEDAENFLKSRPEQIEWDKLQIENIGHRLVTLNQKRYLRERVAAWKEKLEPLPDHFDRRVNLRTPLRKPGAYLLTARMEGGNTSQVVVWLHDTVIVKKRLATETGDAGSGPAWYFVADARTGEPVAGALLDFFGYWRKWRDQPGARRGHEVLTTQFAEYTGSDGQVIPAAKDLLPDAQQAAQWVVTATTRDGRFAYHGFSPVWREDRHDSEPAQTRVYGITDRPVYRPGHVVKFKFWLGRSRYDQPDESEFAGQPVHVRIRNPKGEEVFVETRDADAWGGIAGEYALPDDADLGVYMADVADQRAVTFRVEEYKKPEFEVTVEAPAEPVQLGDAFEAVIQARYYFGAPVSRGRAKIKVTRSRHDARWFPPGRWDWMYGPGYAWFGGDYEWYPGWHAWGCRRPFPPWWPAAREPPEQVVDQESDLDEEGVARLRIDTALARAMYGDQDHRYEITAEVTDASRRTIVGSGQVLVAREPFQVYAWVDRGFYRAGEVIQARFAARTLAGRPVAGTGKLRVLSIRYDKKRSPVETVIGEYELNTDEEGQARQQLNAAEPGQYRLAFAVTDAAGRTREGGHIFVVRGEADGLRDLRFNQLELTPEKSEQRPGEPARLLVQADRENATVLLFIRPVNGHYLPPRRVRLNGRSALQEIDVVAGDMPNFFVEAITVSDGKLYTEIRELAVPPESRILNLAVLPSATSYAPGAPASVQLRLTDFRGEPFHGSTALSVYDRAVEYISGGSNVPEIRAFFWSWRRRHQPLTEHTLARESSNLVPEGGEAMRPLGFFGDGVADDFGFGGPPRRAMRMAGVSGVRGGTLEMAAAPASAPADLSLGFAAEQKLDESAGPAPVEPVVRQEFADTAFWTGALETDSNGLAEVEFTMPENLTGWKMRAWAMGPGTRVGEGTAEAVTTKNLLLRLQAPRFFVEKDEVVLSANIHNYLESDKSVRAVLELEGGGLEALDPPEQSVTVAAGGEARVDWRVKAVREGEAVVRMKALTDEESDAMQMRFPVQVHGLLKTDSYSGVIRPEAEQARFEIRVPDERKPEQTRLEIRYSPTLAGALVDALPYLADYPYGCTEQTLSRFLPAALTRKVLLDLGLDLKAIADKRSHLNAQEIGDPAGRAAQWKRFNRNPVFDEAELNDMIRDGLKRLYDMQLSDGGWGWFSGWGERSSAHLTAHVVRGLLLARESGLAVVPGVLDRGIGWLRRHQVEQISEIRKKKLKNRADDLDALVYLALVEGGVDEPAMRDLLFRDRNDLSVYAKALLGLALDRRGPASMRDTVLENVRQYLVEDPENQTAWLNLGHEGYWWFWYGSEFEAHAAYLKLLARTAPQSPATAGLVKYLLNNRKHATYWNSTRDTALCVEALAEYLRASGEDRPDLALEILVDGELRKEVRIGPDDLFTFDPGLVIEGEALSGGAHTVELRKSGRGPLYYNAYLTSFTLEDLILRAGLEIKVNRRIYRLRDADQKQSARGSRGQVVSQRASKFEREELSDGSALESGDLVEVELTIESKNDYEYLVFEDMKAAGFEPVDVRSGYTGHGPGAYVEYRDNRVVFFIQRLARGTHSVAYRLRAEIPGAYSALPTRGYAMYAPELRANSDEHKLRVVDRAP
jgi:uncharacterized protein YfaS (alpha-2-macroglobulin family)